MGQHSQKRAEKNRKRLEKRRKEMERSKKRQAQEIHLRPELRIYDRKPVAWVGECPEDVAIFDANVRQTLSEELQQQAVEVRQALEDVCNRVANDSQDRLATISRRSPFSDWRLLIRGLTAWFGGQKEEARSAWERLDKERRPWRIALTLILSDRQDLTEIKLKIPGDEKQGSDPWEATADNETLANAKVTRQVFIERVALRSAQGLLRIEDEELSEYDEDEQILLPDHFRFLKEFSAKYESLEPELVRALEVGFIRIAANLNYADLFEYTIKELRGSGCDPENNLAGFLYFSLFKRPSAEEYLKDYIEKDLPKLSWCTPTIAGALSSMLRCMQANVELNSYKQNASRFFSFRFFGESSEDVSNSLAKARIYFDKALVAYPANQAAYWGYEQSFELALDDSSLLVGERAKLEAARAEIWEKKLLHLSDDIDTRLKLVDYLLENGESQKAKAHVDLLRGTRRADPVADAMYWRWHLLEVQRVCGKKTSLPQAAPLMLEVDRLWPRWLSKDWLPYLNAALAYRAGDLDAFEKIPVETRPHSILTQSCMILGAAQYMSFPTAQLKPLRERVDEQVKHIKSVADVDLLSAANFFWDVTRAKIRYSAYRLHAPKFLKALASRPSLGKMFEACNGENSELKAALLVMATDKIFNHSNTVKIPSWLRKAMNQGNPFVLASFLIATLGEDWPRVDEANHLAEQLRTKAESVHDPFYRFYFLSIVERVEREIRPHPMEKFFGF